MRYLGDLPNILPGGPPSLPAGLAQPARGPMDPTQKALLMSQAPSVDDAMARDLGDIVDATPEGHRTMLLRFGIGGVVGLAVGYGLAKLL